MSRPRGYLVPGYVEASTVVRAVAHGFGVSVDDIMSDCGKRRVQTARMCAMAIVKQVTGWSYPSVGGYFGRHHTTVMNAVDRVANDPTLAAGAAAVVEELQPPPTLFSVPKQEAV